MVWIESFMPNIDYYINEKIELGYEIESGLFNLSEDESFVIKSKEEYDALISKIKELESENKKLSIENASMKGKLLNIKDGDHVTTDNVNLIKRINLLEKFLYEIGYDPSKIK